MTRTRGASKETSDALPVTIDAIRALLQELKLPELVASVERLDKATAALATQLQQQKALVVDLATKVEGIEARTRDLEAFNAAPIREAVNAETPEEIAREVSRIMENDKSVMLVFPAGTTDVDKKAAEEMFQPAPTAIRDVNTSSRGTHLRKMTFASAAHARTAASKQVRQNLRNKKIYIERVLTPKQNTHKHDVGVPLAKIIRNSTRYNATYTGTYLRVWLKDSDQPGKTINTAQFNANNVPKTLIDPRLQALLHQAFPPSAPTSPRPPPRSPSPSSNQQHASTSNQQQQQQQQQGDKRTRESASPTPSKEPKRFAPGSTMKAKTA